MSDHRTRLRAGSLRTRHGRLRRIFLIWCQELCGFPADRSLHPLLSQVVSDDLYFYLEGNYFISHCFSGNGPMSKSYEVKAHGRLMSGKCLDRLAARGLEILLALNSSSCRLLDSAHQGHHGKGLAARTVESKPGAQAKQSRPKGQ